MKLKFKLNLQQFATIQGRADAQDGDDDGFVNVTSNNTTYKIPSTIFNYGSGSNLLLGIGATADANANINFVTYYLEKGGNAGTFADFKSWLDSKGIELSGDVINSSNYAAMSAGVGTRVQEALNSGQIISTNPDGTEQVIRQLTPVSDGLEVPGGDQASAFNAYYNDIYSLEPGTGGAEMLGRLEQSYANQAQQAATMADVGFQQAAMQQAQTVKQITDQVRGERLARLRAGMSESQTANQDMQMLMTNVNTLNQNAQMLNDQRLQAQIGMNTAQDQAYMDFLAQANQRGQVGSAMAASDAGDTYQQTIKQMSTLYGADPSKWTASQWTQTSNRVATGNPAGNVTK